MHTPTRLAIAALAACCGTAAANPTVFSASGAGPASIQSTVDAFRTAISEGGVFNAPNTGPFTNGRREINWDAPALDAFQSPARMPADFFNNNNRRGAAFGTPDGTGFLVSRRVTDGSGRFGDIDPSYNGAFSAFSQLRLFAVEGGVVSDAHFFVPTDPARHATVNGFGAVFTDVDIAGSTRIEFFDENNLLLRSLAAPVSPDGGLSFLGVYFGDGERVDRVRIASGNTAMGSGITDSADRDIVAMDDFFYGEPRPIPAPAGFALVSAGLLAAGGRRRR